MTPEKALKYRLPNLFRASTPSFYELHVMYSSQPDIVVWRRSLDEIKALMQQLQNKDDCVEGFAVFDTDQSAALYDPKGNKTEVLRGIIDPECLHGDPPQTKDDDIYATRMIVNPVHVASSFRKKQTAMNLEANYTAALRRMLKHGAEYVVCVSHAAHGGGDALYVDPIDAPTDTKNVYLDSRKFINSGLVYAWNEFDNETFRAANSYRVDDFCQWVSRAMRGKKDPASVKQRLVGMERPERTVIIWSALTAIIPEITYFTDADAGTPEEIEDLESVVLPDDVLKTFS